METIIFLVYHPGRDIENVIVSASGRELAKHYAHRILGGNSDNYVVEPITKKGTHTVILMTPTH